MSDLDLLNETLVAEYLGIAAYDAALASGLLSDATADAARAFRSDHVQHRETISKAIIDHGGVPVPARRPDDYARAFPPLTSEAEIVAYAIELEAGAARSYLATVPQYEDPNLALLGAQIGAVEAQHWAVLLAASGANPVPSPMIDVQVVARMGGNRST